jgi:hypothetical protein
VERRKGPNWDLFFVISVSAATTAAGFNRFDGGGQYVVFNATAWRLVLDES